MSDQHKYVEQAVDHLFRHEAGKMIAVLSRTFGIEHLELVEDVVQDTLLRAFEVWQFRGIPDNPSGWLFTVARNKAIDRLRRNQRQIKLEDANAYELFSIDQSASESQEQLITDDMLRMMFACCHSELQPESQVTMILKYLCGFSTAEVARAFAVPEDTVSKRLYRSKAFFRKNKIKLELPSVHGIIAATDAVLRSVYFLFNEGYRATNNVSYIRDELMSEAIRLGQLLLGNELTRLPETYALLALMCFQASRTESRINVNGMLIPFAEQKKETWDEALIQEGNQYLDMAAFGDRLTTYHLEAAIAQEYATAMSFETINWQRILSYYDDLLSLMPGSTFIKLNRAVVILHLHGVEAAIDELERLSSPQTDKYHLYHMVLAEAYSGIDPCSAIKHLNRAIQLTRNPVEQAFIRSKIDRLTAAE